MANPYINNRDDKNFPWLNVSTETVQFEKFYFGATGAVAKRVLADLTPLHRDHALRMSAIYEDISPVYDQLLITIRGWLLKSLHEEVKTISVAVPATWWDHLKHDLLNSGKPWKVWLAQRFDPPTMTTKTEMYKSQVRVCPHNDTYFSDDQQHINWLLWKNDKTE